MGEEFGAQQLSGERQRRIRHGTAPITLDTWSHATLAVSHTRPSPRRRSLRP